MTYSHMHNQFETAALEIGNRIYKRRKELGLSQNDLYIRTGIPRQTISSIENGNRVATVSTLTALAEGLGVSLSELQPLVLDRYSTFSPEITALCKRIQALSFQKRHELLVIINKIME